jgi:hypothetical protein
VLFDEEDGHALVGRRAHRSQQAVDDHRRETERELVDEQHAAAAGEATREREHLLLPTRQQTDAALEVWLELGKQRQRTIEVAPADAQVLARGEVHEDGSFLRHHAEARARPHMEGGVGACAEQADVAAEDIAASAGTDIDARPFDPSSRAQLVGLPAGRFLNEWLALGEDEALRTDLPASRVPILTYLARDLTAGWRGAI